jgi:hypothetical protein
MKLTWSKVDNVKLKHSEKNLYATRYLSIKTTLAALGLKPSLRGERR